MKKKEGRDKRGNRITTTGGGEEEEEEEGEEEEEEGKEYDGHSEDSAAIVADSLPPTKANTNYPPMPNHPKARSLGLPEDDYDLDNPWGDFDGLQEDDNSANDHLDNPRDDNSAKDHRRFVQEKTDLDYLREDVEQLKDMRKYSLEEEDELVAHYREMQEESSNNAHNVPMMKRQNLYDMHKSNPEEWDVGRLSREFGLKRKRVEAIIKLFDMRSGMDQAYVRHELEDLIVEMEFLTLSEEENELSNHSELENHFDRANHSKRFIQLNETETRIEVQENLDKAHKVSMEEAKGEPAQAVIGEATSNRGKIVSFVAL
jgi:hypothetical protein